MIPELNKIAEKYKPDEDVVFISVCLDEPEDIREFQKKRPVQYRIIDRGRFVSERYKINLFPVNVVIDREGKVFFHSDGYKMSTPLWIRKSIEELKNTNQP